MRIIAGQWRRRVLDAPKGSTTRPTADRSREALFSMLASRLGSFEGLVVADIFAGTGALGLEALSRGAAACTFVEQDSGAVKTIRANLAKLGAAGDVLPIGVSAIGPARRPHDVIMFDPPYGSGGAGALLEKMTRLGWAAPHAWASVETGQAETVSAEGWAVDAERRHGIAKLTLLVRSPSAPPG